MDQLQQNSLEKAQSLVSDQEPQLNQLKTEVETKETQLQTVSNQLSQAKSIIDTLLDILIKIDPSNTSYAKMKTDLSSINDIIEKLNGITDIDIDQKAEVLQDILNQLDVILKNQFGEDKVENVESKITGFLSKYGISVLDICRVAILGSIAYKLFF